MGKRDVFSVSFHEESARKRPKKPLSGESSSGKRNKLTIPMGCMQYMVERKHTTREWDYWLDFQRLLATWLQDLPRVLGITATPLARGAASSEPVCAHYLCKTSRKSLQDPFGIHTEAYTPPRSRLTAIRSVCWCIQAAEVSASRSAIMRDYPSQVTPSDEDPCGLFLAFGEHRLIA